tara:strand:+ start:323 stop:1171 length:849 start_codon:yes stop_codon:yes gene_type:complete
MKWIKKIKKKKKQSINDLLSMMKIAYKNKLITLDALKMIEGVLKVGKRQVHDIMVPRSHMVVLRQGQSQQQILNLVIESPHSRLPVIAEDKDNVIGILHVKDLLNLIPLNQTQINKKLNSLIQEENLRTAIFVPESQQLDTLFKTFKKTHHHLAIVVDEFGGITGLVTIEDVLEEIVGEIEDEFDIEAEEQIKKISKNKYKINALTLIEDFNDKFKSNIQHSHVDTMGGLITQHYGAVPKKGIEIELENYKFIVKEANERRIVSIHLEILQDKDKNKDKSKK